VLPEAQKCVLEQSTVAVGAARLDGAPHWVVFGRGVLSDLDMPPFAKALMDGSRARPQTWPGAGQLVSSKRSTAGISRAALSAGPGARIMKLRSAPEDPKCRHDRAFAVS